MKDPTCIGSVLEVFADVFLPLQRIWVTSSNPYLTWRKTMGAVVLMTIQTTTVMATDLEAELRQLKAEVKRLNNRIEQLEEKSLQQPIDRKTTTVIQSANSNTDKDRNNKRLNAAKTAKGNFQIPGINTSVTVGGRVKLDTIYNNESVGGSGGKNSGDLAFTPAAIPVGGQADEDDQFTFSIRESRFWLKSYTRSDYGDLNAYFELDFFADQSPGNERVSNSHTPRLRHGYATFGNLLFGQTWTTFMNVASFPEHNDSTGPVAMIDVRQSQIRWTQPFSWGDFQFAVEEPETTLTNATGNRITPDDDRYPDIVAKLTFRGDWGQASMAGLLREIRSDGAVQAGVSDEAIGGAVNIAGRLKAIGSDNLRFSFSYGNALGRYIALNAFNAGAINPQGQIDFTTLTGGFVSYQHWWNNSLRSTISYSFVHADNDLSRVPGTVTESIESYHSNLLWSPIWALSFGIEFIHAQRELENGNDGSLNRFQLTAIYNF